MKKIVGSIVVYFPDMEKLKKTIETVLNTYENAEIYVWDNSAQASVGTNLKIWFPFRVKYTSSPDNLGYGRGNNEVFKSIEGQFDYFCVLNPDLELPEGSLASLVQYMEAHPAIGLTSGTIRGPDGKRHDVHKFMPSFTDYVTTLLKRFLKKGEPKTVRPELPLVEPFSLPIISGCFMLFTRDHFKRLNGFDDRYFLYFEDYDLSLRSFILKSSVIVPSVSIIHGWARDSHKSAKLFFIQMKSGLQFFWKWGLTSRFPKKINDDVKL